MRERILQKQGLRLSFTWADPSCLQSPEKNPLEPENLIIIFLLLLYWLLFTLEGAARYAGLFLPPAEGFGLRPSFLYYFDPNFGNFW